MADEVLGISAKFDINDIGRSIDALCNSLTGIGSSAEAASRIIQQAFSNVDAASTTTVQDIENVLNKLESLSAHKKKDLEIAQGTLEKLAQEQEKLQERMRSVEANTEAYSELERKLEGVGQQLVNQSAFVNALTQESDALANAVNTVTDALEQMRQKSAETPAPSIVAPEGGGESAPAVDTSAIVEGANAATEALDATTEAAKQTSEAVSSVTESSEALNTAAESATNVAQGVEAINEQASRTGEAVEQTGTSFAKRLYDAQMQVLHLKELWQEQKQTVAELQAQVDGMNGMVPERLKYELQEQKDLLAEYTTRLQQAQLDVERIKVEQQMFGDESNKTATALEAILMQLDKWQQAISNQEQLNARLQEQRDNFAAIQESVNALSESTDPLIEKYQQLKQEFENLNSYTGVIKSEGNEDELKQHYDDLTLTTRQYREAVVEASAAAKGAFQLQQQAVNALEGELKQLEDALAQALATKNTDAADALSQQIATMSGQLENAKEKLAELGEKAQQTESELNKMAQTTQQMTDSVNASWLDTLKEKLVAGKDAVVGWATGHGKAQEAISSFGNAVGKLPGPLGNVITSIKGMTKASWAFISTPIGIVLGAIALALQAVFKWFNKSSEGQMVFAKISGYVGSILESLTDILMKVGSYLFHAFADAQGPMHAFAQGLVTTLKYAVQAAAKLLNGLGDMLHGIGLMFQGEFSQGWDVLSAGFDKAMHGVEDAVRSAIEGVKTAFEGSIGMLKMGIDAAKAFSATDFEAGASKIHKNAVATANMKEQEKRLEIELGEATMKREQQQQEYNEKLSKMYHLQGAERKKAIEELKKMRKDMFQPQIDAQTQLLDLYTRQANMHTRSLESFKQERDMRTNILRLQAQQAGAARMLERMEASTDRKMESQAKSAAKRAAAEAKRDAKTKQKIEEAEAELGNVTIDNAEARTRQAVELQEKIDEATISAMEKGRKKVIKEREYAMKQELDKLADERDKKIEEEKKLQEKEYNALRKLALARGEKMDPWDEEKHVDAKATQAIIDKYEELTKLTQQRQQNEWLEAQQTALRNFLKEYGDFEKKKLAITEEYEEKIKQAQSPTEVAALRLQAEKEQRELEAKEFQQSIDWSGIFSTLQGHTKEYLQGLAEQLQSVINEGTLPPDQLAVVQDKLREINSEISKQSGLFDFTGDRQREYTRLVQEAADAQARLTARKQQEETAQSEAEDARQQMWDFLEEQLGESAQVFIDNLKRAAEEGEEVDVASLNDSLLENFKPDSKEYNEAWDILEQLRVSEAHLVEARKESKKAADEAKKAEDRKNRKPAQAIADWFADAQQFIKAKGIDLIPGLLNSLGLSGASESASKGLSAINNAAGAAADFASSNYVGAAMKGLNAIMDVGDLLGIGGTSDKTLEKDIERLTASNEALKNALDMLAEKLDDSAVADAAGVYQQMRNDIQQSEKNTREMMQRSGAVYDSGRLGFIGGKGSSNSKINANMTAEMWSRVSRAAKTSVNSAAAFFSLTSEQMYMVARDAPEMYARIKQYAADGYKDASQYMDSYINYWKELQDAEDKYYQKMTSTTLDSLTSEFTSALMDMDSSAANFADNFEKYMQNAIINALVSNKYEPLLKKWYEKMAAYMEGGMTEQEAARLKQDWNAIVQQGLKDREDLRQMFSWGATGEGSGAYSAAQSFSQDQGDELNGRLTAIQIGQQTGIAQRAQIVELQNASLGQFVQLNGRIINIASDIGEMREIQFDSLRRLSEIRDFTSVLPAMAGDIQDMRNDIRNKL